MQGISAALYIQLPDICIKVGHGSAMLAQQERDACCLDLLSLIGAIYSFSLSVFLLETI